MNDTIRLIQSPEFEQHFQEYIAQKTASAVTLGSNYQQLWKGIAELTSTGKRIRPYQFLTAYRLLGGNNKKTSLAIATALELVHTALILHDDIVDQDLTRRGQPNIIGSFSQTSQKLGLPLGQSIRWGEANALLAGDLLLASTFKILGSLDEQFSTREKILTQFEKSIQLAASGEQLDLAFAWNIMPASPQGIDTMMYRKTSHYSFQLPLILAGQLAWSSSRTLTVLEKIGKIQGTIYQLTDDFLGVFGETKNTGKSTQSDLTQGKKTLLIEIARHDPRWNQYQHLWGNPQADAFEIEKLKSFLIHSGAVEKISQIISSQTHYCMYLIENSDLPQDLKNHLSLFTQYLKNREA